MSATAQAPWKAEDAVLWALALGRSHSRTLTRTLAVTALGNLLPWKGLPPRGRALRPARAFHRGPPWQDSAVGRPTTAVPCHASRGPNKRPVGCIPNAAARIALELGVGDECSVREGLEGNPASTAPGSPEVQRAVRDTRIQSPPDCRRSRSEAHRQCFGFFPLTESGIS
jgi:hypothetical protein